MTEMRLTVLVRRDKTVEDYRVPLDHIEYSFDRPDGATVVVWGGGFTGTVDEADEALVTGRIVPLPAGSFVQHVSDDAPPWREPAIASVTRGGYVECAVTPGGILRIGVWHDRLSAICVPPGTLYASDFSETVKPGATPEEHAAAALRELRAAPPRPVVP